MMILRVLRTRMLMLWRRWARVARMLTRWGSSYLHVLHPHVDLLLLLPRHDARLLPLLGRQGLGSLDVGPADSVEVKARDST